MRAELAIRVRVKFSIEVKHENYAYVCSNTLVKLCVMVLLRPNYKGTHLHVLAHKVKITPFTIQCNNFTKHNILD